MGQLSFFTYDENTDPNVMHQFKTPTSQNQILTMIKEQKPKRAVDILQNALPTEL